MPAALTRDAPLSSAPILEAVERYRGTIIDLDAQRALGPDEFARLRAALMVRLQQAGLDPGARVVVALANGPLFIATLTAILACEASPLLVHYKTPVPELDRYARRFGASFLACEPTIQAELATIETGSTEICLSDTAVLHWGRLPSYPSTGSGPLLRGVPLHPTSGSTGLPKIALRPGLPAIEEARHYATTLSIGADDSIIAIPPMSHAYGYGMCVMVPLLTGANIVSLRSFSAKNVQRALELHPVTILPAAPAMLTVLAFGGGIDLHDVRWLLTAGAMLPGRTAAQIHQKTGVYPCPLYGTTETGGISIATAADGRDVDGRVGLAMEGVSVDVHAPRGSLESADEPGNLYVRSTSMMTGYLDDQGQVTMPAEDGWFATGDLARLGHDGTIHLRGRDSEVVNVAGLKVVPCEVEEVISRLPGVREVKIYAGAHRSGTEFVKAAVAVDGHLTAIDIREYCEQQLVYFKRPQNISLVEALPRNAAGKIVRDLLP